MEMSLARAMCKEQKIRMQAESAEEKSDFVTKKFFGANMVI